MKRKSGKEKTAKQPVAKRRARLGVIVARTEAGELSLYSDGRVESSSSVKDALMKSCLGINNREGSDQRFKLAMALWQLMECSAGQFTGDRDELLDSLCDTLGANLLDTLNISQGADKRFKVAKSKLRNAFHATESAYSQLVRFRSKLPLPGDKSNGAWTWMIQRTAKEIIRATKLPPSKTSIRIQMEADGWGYLGKDSNGNWEKRFEAAGLKKLKP